MADAGGGPGQGRAVRNVTKAFEATGGAPLRAVHDLSLDLRRNEALTLLGPSGCGKTTLLRITVGIGAGITQRLRDAEAGRAVPREGKAVQVSLPAATLRVLEP